VPKTKINSLLGDVLTLTLEYNFVLKIRKTTAKQAWPGLQQQQQQQQQRLHFTNIENLSAMTQF
jgi:hypothetical protein